MNWKLKAFVQGAISAMPKSADINYAFQKYITRTVPQPETVARHALDTTLSDFPHIAKQLGVPLGEARCFEFGAGAGLLGPLTFYSLGINHQVLVDIHRLVRPNLVNWAIEFLRKQQDTVFCRQPHALIPDGMKGQPLLDWLKSTYGFHYHAPCDARSTQFPGESFDLITSRAVFEHVPAADIKAILKECHRILAGNGVAAFRTDYQDHYSYCDPSVTIYDFLQYSDKQWRRYSPSLHYTNRLRHRDYLEMFNLAGFDVRDDVTYEIRDEDLLILKDLPKAMRFGSYTNCELAVRGALTVLHKVTLSRDRVIAPGLR
jgi:SAM-dependent methyltransferase